MAEGRPGQCSAIYHSIQKGLMLMVALFDKVKINNNGVMGYVVDIYNKRGKDVYIVEAETPDAEGNYELYDCFADELTRV